MAKGSRAAGIAVFIVVVAGYQAASYADERPTKIEFFQQTEGGKLAACGTRFTYVFTNAIGQPGRLMKVYGSLTYRGFPGGIVAVLKFSPMDFLSGPTEKPTAFSPAQTTVQARDGQILRFTRYQCEPVWGEYCAGVGGDPALPLIASAGKGITITFNRDKDSLDYRLSLVFDPPPDGTDIEKFFESAKQNSDCMVALGKQIVSGTR
jgi:hypothetical protein